MSIVDGLPTEWLGSITEKIVVYLISNSSKDSIKFKKFLSTLGIEDLEDSFRSIYVHSVIEYTKKSESKLLGYLFVLDEVVEKFNEFYIGEIESIEKFQEQFLKILAQNAFRNRHLVELYYLQSTIDFRREIEIFINTLDKVARKASPPSSIKLNGKVDKVLERIETLNKSIQTSKNEFRKNYNSFKSKYFPVLKNSINKIDFYGLSLPRSGTNRPNEIDLVALFVEPSFKRLNQEQKEKNVKSHYIESFLSYGLSDNYIGTYYGETITNQSSSFKKSSYDLDQLIRESDSNSQEKKLKQNNVNNHEEITELNSLLLNGSRIVVLGNPGAGKSSLVKFIALKILKQDFDSVGLTSQEDILPFILPLKDYAKFKKDKRGGFLKFLYKHLESDFQITSYSVDFIEHILIEKKNIIFFDGLDEIFDKKLRRDIKNDIEIFSNEFMNSIIIVTSRYESYNEVYFSSSNFIEFGVNEFDDKRLTQYIDKWFLVDIDDLNRRKERRNQFIKELEVIGNELKRNPLLLSLILLIYKYENALPKSKLEIYESCSETLIERRDSKDKKLEFVIQIKRKMSLFAELAYWQYRKLSEKKEADITHNNAKLVIVNFLTQSEIIADLGDAEIAADEFMEFAKLRSIYFENDFTHKTFLEYLTAYYIYVNYHFKGKIKERNNLILKYIDKSFWSIVIELLLLIIDRRSPDFEVMNELISLLIEEKEDKVISFLIFLFDKFDNLGDKVKKKIINLNIDYCIKHVEEDKRGESIFFEGLCEQLLKGRYLEIYQSSINKKLEELVFSSSENNSNNSKINNLLILSYEIEYSTGISVARPNEINGNFHSPYLFIISNYKSIIKMDWDKYFILLRQFTSQFSQEKVSENYKSPFDKKHYLGSSSFNWLFYPLFSHDSVELFQKNYHKLIDLGYSKSFLEKAVKKAVFSNRMGTETKITLAKNPAYRQLIINSLPNIRNKIKKSKKHNKPFYHHYIYDEKKNFNANFGKLHDSRFNAKKHPRRNN